MAVAHTTHGRYAACGAAERAGRRYVRTLIGRGRLLAAATLLKAYLPPGMAARLANGPTELWAPKHPSQVAFEMAGGSTSWTVSGGGSGGARMAGNRRVEPEDNGPAVAVGAGGAAAAAGSSSWTVSGAGDGGGRMVGASWGGPEGKRPDMTVRMGRARGTCTAMGWREAERAVVQSEIAARAPWRAAVAFARLAKREARTVGAMCSAVQREIAFRAAGGRGTKVMEREDAGTVAPSPSPHCELVHGPTAYGQPMVRASQAKPVAGRQYKGRTLGRRDIDPMDREIAARNRGATRQGGKEPVRTRSRADLAPGQTVSLGARRSSGEERRSEGLATVRRDSNAASRVAPLLMRLTPTKAAALRGTSLDGARLTRVRRMLAARFGSAVAPGGPPGWRAPQMMACDIEAMDRDDCATR
jgi:hypothetical protein